MKRLIALLLTLVLLLALFVFAGCDQNDNEVGAGVKNNNKQGLDAMYIRETCTDRTILEYRAIYEETGFSPIDFDKLPKKVDDTYPDVKINVYYAVGFGMYMIISKEEYEDIQRYQNETGRQVLYPTVSLTERKKMKEKNKYYANIYYKTEDITADTIRPALDENGDIVPNYWKYEAGHQSGLMADYNSLRIEGKDGIIDEKTGKQYFYAYGRKVDGGIEVRMFQYEFYLYLNKTRPKDSDKRIFGINVDDVVEVPLLMYENYLRLKKTRPEYSDK